VTTVRFPNSARLLALLLGKFAIGIDHSVGPRPARGQVVPLGHR
jgi:hypothetical protein